jgi:hypothetical protein
MSSQNIQIRRVSITDPKDLPKHGIAETPGGTLFGTTPGGTRIIYDRLFLLQRKESPAAKTPPRLPNIPGVTADLDSDGPNIGTTDNRRISIIRENSQEEEETEELNNNKHATSNNNNAEMNGNDNNYEDDDDLGMEM